MPINMYTLNREGATTLKHVKYVPATNQVESDREIQTTLNSFFLGNQHKISSGAENIFFQNIHADINWHPAWAGIKNQSVPANQSEEGIIPPSFRTYDALVSIKPYGEPAVSGAVPYYKPAMVIDEHSVYGQQFITEERVEAEDWLKYQTWYGTDTSGIQAYEQAFTGVAYNPGDTVDWWFDHPVEGHTGTPIVTLVKIHKGGENGPASILMVRESVTPGVHYSNIRIRKFYDRDVMAGVAYTTTDRIIGHAGTYAVDATAGTITLTVNNNVGYKSFMVFDASQSFTPMHKCNIVFGGTQGTLVLQNKNDSYMFYFDGTLWRYLDLNTKNGGIV